MTTTVVQAVLQDVVVVVKESRIVVNECYFDVVLNDMIEQEKIFYRVELDTFGFGVYEVQQ